MAVSTRTRFIAISVSITVIAFLLFTHVIYDKVGDYRRSLEIHQFQSLTSQFLNQYSSRLKIDQFEQQLKVAIAREDQPASLFAVYAEDGSLHSEFHLSSVGLEESHSSLLSKIRNDLSNDDGDVNIDGQAYYWQRNRFESSDDAVFSFYSVYALSESSLSETMHFFGAPLLISGFLLLWTMVWSSIILSSFVVRLENQKKELSGQSHDLEKARDEALQANQAKSTFLANMSHEIRTPLTSIIGFAESCLDSKQSTEEKQEATSTIIRSGNHLLNIISDILDISKIEAGKVDLDMSQVNLVDLLKEVNLIMKGMAQDKGLTFGINSNFPLPKNIKTDSLRLKQILLNLCSNSIKFTESGHVNVNVYYWPRHDCLNIDVVDTGIGMTELQLQHIFDPFQQADSTITRKYGGTGLGLTLTKQLVEMLNGKISVESQPDKGSQFTVQFEVAGISESDLIYEASYENENIDSYQVNEVSINVKGNILVAEDNYDLKVLARILIGRTGADMEIVENGEQAVEKAMSGKFDLVFLDLQMPIMGGIEAIKRLREKGYTKPIVAMTANAMNKDKQDCLAAGFDDFVSKPVNITELYCVINKYLQPIEADKELTSNTTSVLTDKNSGLEDMVDSFIYRLPDIIKSINESVNDKKWNDLSSQLHQFRGITGVFGFPLLSQLTEEIEGFIDSKDYPMVNAKLDGLNKVCWGLISENKK